MIPGETQRVKMTQYDPLYLLSTTGGQQEGEHIKEMYQESL